TICHEGEGHGTSIAGAHGHLERSQRPLWEGEFIESSCGTCHPDGELDSAPVLSRGRDLYRGFYCSFCHRLGDEGGDVGPDLTSVGSKPIFQFDFRNVEGHQTVANWMMAHFRDPARVTPGTKMPNYRLADEDVTALTVYMLSLTGEELPANYRLEPFIFFDEEYIEAASPGEELYLESCAVCHGDDGEGREHFAPALNNQAWLSIVTDEFIEGSIASGRPGTPMFTWHEDQGGVFSEQRIGELVEFIRSWQSVPSQEIRVGPVQGDPENGERLYARACASCHGEDGQGWRGPALNNAAFLAIASDAYIREIVAAAKRRRPVRTCLQDSEAITRISDAGIDDIVAFVRSWESAEAESPTDDVE
ncbi:MAG: c-type cytochrome, partial [Armatimonadota bacterium]